MVHSPCGILADIYRNSILDGKNMKDTYLLAVCGRCGRTEETGKKDAMEAMASLVDTTGWRKTVMGYICSFCVKETKEIEGSLDWEKKVSDAKTNGEDF